MLFKYSVTWEGNIVFYRRQMNTHTYALYRVYVYIIYNNILCISL